MEQIRVNGASGKNEGLRFLRGGWKVVATSTWDGIEDDKGCEGSGDVSSTSEATS